MRISTKLRVAATVPAILAVAIGAILFVSLRSVRMLEHQEIIAHRISESMGDLNDVAHSYVLRHEDRLRRQFLKKHDELTERIAAAVFEGREQQRVLARIAKRTAAVKGLFLKLVSNYERHGSIREEALLRDAEKQLVGQLVIRSRDAKSEASHLLRLLSDDIVAGQRRIFLLALAVTAAATAPVTLLLLGLMKRIGASLERLRRGTELIGGGNLDHRIGISSKDEIGDLSRAFDLMSGKLHATTVSRDRLAAEVEERKRSEAALEKELVERKLAEERARHLASFPRLNPNPVLEADTSGNVVFFNQSTQRILEALGLGEGDVRAFVPDDLDAVLRYWDRKKELILHREVRLKSRVFAETIFLTPDFQVARIYAFDVTLRKRAEEELRAAKQGLEQRVVDRTAELARSEERFRALVEHIPVGICIVREGRIVYRNPEQARLFGAMPEEFELRELRDIHPEDTEKFQKLCAAVTGDDPDVQEMDLRFYPYGKSAEGTDLRWVQVRTIPMEYGGEKAVLVSMVDITRLKEMEYQFLVREKMASLGHVAAGIAHEIRNPLSGINIHLAALHQIWERSDGLEAESQEAVEAVIGQIQSASDRIESVIRKVMEFSRTAVVRTDSADLLQAIEGAVEFTSTQLRRERIALDRSRLGAVPRCPVDSALITQVMMNLIVNAAQAMERMDGDKAIGISSSVENDRIVICVSDSGPGIPPALRDRIFDPFYTTRKDGYGIGLSFCRRVISEHGGTLTVDTGRLGGAEFRIEIPFGPKSAGPRGTEVPVSAR